jgi:hypothetical protein
MAVDTASPSLAANRPVIYGGSAGRLRCRHAGQPLNPNGLSGRLNDCGISTTAARTAAIRQQILEMPAPVVADALGYHHVTTTCLASEAGGSWSRYAAGDHTRSPAGWTPRELVTVE